MRILAATCSALFMLLTSGWAQQAQELFGVSAENLLSIDPTTGAGTVIGPTGLAFPYGVAAMEGKLYAFDQASNELYQLNPTTGQALDPVSIGVKGLAGEGDVAFGPDGTGFLSTAFSGDPSKGATNDLYTFNVDTGKAVRVGSTGDVTLDGLAFSANHTLYGIGSGPATAAFATGQEDLYKVNPTNGHLTLVGGLGVDGSAFAGLTFTKNGALYGAVNDALYSINTKTGRATPVNKSNLLGIGDGSVSGLAAAPVPEPSSVGLGLLGLVSLSGFLALRRSRVS